MSRLTSSLLDCNVLRLLSCFNVFNSVGTGGKGCYGRSIDENGLGNTVWSKAFVFIYCLAYLTYGLDVVKNS